MNEISRFEDFELLAKAIVDLKLVELIAAAIGTFLGAYFAYQFARNDAREVALIREDSALSQAVQLATSYLDPAINLKTQMIFPKQEELNTLQDAYNTFSLPGEIPLSPVVIRHLWTFFAPIDFSMLRIVESTRFLNSVAGRPLTCAIHLERDAANLTIMFDQYNRIALEIQKLPQDSLDAIKRIIGEPLTATFVDKQLPETVKSISEIVDRMIFLSYLLAKDLSQHQKSWRQRNGLNRRKTISWELRNENLALLPDDKSFATFLDLPVVALD